MPLPSKDKGENPKSFMSRCMSSDKMKSEYPDQKQRTAVCMSKASEGLSYVESTDLQLSWEKEQGGYRYENPKTGEIFTYRRKGVYKKDGVFLNYIGKATEE